MNNVVKAVKEFLVDGFFTTFRTSGRSGNTDDIDSYKEVTKYREDSDFIRIVPCALLLLLTEVCGLFTEFLIGYDPYYFKYYISTSISSFIVCSFFCLFVNHVLKMKSNTDTIKTISTKAYWLFHTASALTFSTCEMLDNGTQTNLYILIAIFTFIPLLKPKFKALYLSVSGITQAIVMIVCGCKLSDIIGMIALLVLAFIISSSIYSSYMTDHILRLRLEKLAEVDPMTGLLNRRGLYKNIDFLLPYYNRHSIKIMVIMCDIDFFKNYNDTFGHAAGDDCIVAISNCIKESFSRKADITARFGGEEFVIVVGGKPDDNLLQHLIHLENNIRALNIEAGKKDASDVVTISLGAYEADTSAGEISFDEMIKKADEQLYIAKMSGRNCIAYGGNIYKEEIKNGSKETVVQGVGSLSDLAEKF